MAENHISEENIEERLRAYYRTQEDDLQAPPDLWARLEPRLEAPEERPSLWQRMFSTRRRGLLAASATLAVLLVVGGIYVSNMGSFLGADAPSAMPPLPAPAPGFLAPGFEEPAGPQATGVAPAPAPRPAPAPAARAPAPPISKEGRPPGGGDGAADLSGQALAADRMIIRDGSLSLVVVDTPRAIEQATQLAADMGGHVVSARMWQEGKRVAGTITIRVPADLFSDALRALKATAVEVITEDASSRDVTEEFVDLSSRLRSMEATEEQLLKIMESATEVADVLAVQRELSRVQAEIEATKGRIQFLERSSATSLIRVTLREVGLDIRIVPSSRKARMGEEVLFSAVISGGFPPYSYRWDLGDGTTSTEEAPVHAYAREGKYDLSLSITDDKGNTSAQVERELMNIAPMEARLDTNRTEVMKGEEIQFVARVAGGFTPYSYQWDLGDGTTSTRLAPRHAYPDAGRYTVTLSITDDRGNTASKTGKQLITVNAPPAWSAGKQVSDALRALSVVGRGLAGMLIWLVIFLPIWGVLAVVVIVLAVRSRRA